MTKPVSTQARIFLIAGPTASGKSELALHLAERYNGTIINADSVQVYNALPILSARPNAETMARAPHRLYGHIAPPHRYSVGQWLDDVATALAEAQGKCAIIVGGTGLYFTALLEGVADIPPIETRIRDWLQARLGVEGAAILYSELADCDPILAARVSASDSQRILRGLEVFMATGRALSDWQAQSAPPLLTAAQVAPFVFLPEAKAERAELYARCDARGAAMLEAGAQAEAIALAAQGLPDDHILMKAVGVRPLLEKTDAETTQAKLQRETRRYAKRQMTWIRNRLIAWNRIDKIYNYKNKPEIDKFISKTLDKPNDTP